MQAPAMCKFFQVSWPASRFLKLNSEFFEFKSGDTIKQIKKDFRKSFRRRAVSLGFYPCIFACLMLETRLNWISQDSREEIIVCPTKLFRRTSDGGRGRLVP